MDSEYLGSLESSPPQRIDLLLDSELAQSIRVKDELIADMADTVQMFPMVSEFILSQKIGKMWLDYIKCKNPILFDLHYVTLKEMKTIIDGSLPQMEVEGLLARQHGHIQESGLPYIKDKQV